jgi:hypothetical protein
VVGEPDLIVLADFGRVFLVELKSRDGKPSQAQQNLAAMARRLGHLVRVVRSLEEFVLLVDSGFK